MQCEQRILRGGPGIPHFREQAPPGAWVGLRHGPPTSQTFLPVSHHHEDLWHAHDDRGLQIPPSSQAPPIPASISPTSESSKHQNRRSRKSERPLPTKSLPASSPSSVEAPSVPSAENASSAEQSAVQRGGKGGESIASKPTILEAHSREVSKDGTETEKSDKTSVPTSQLTPMSNQKVPTTATPTSATATSVFQTAGISGEPQSRDLSPDGLQGLLPGRMRKSKDLAPKELIIEMDHNKYKCQIPGCDKSFRKESGLEYHIKYYHNQKDKAGMKRKKPVAVRSDSTPDTSPEFGSQHRLHKRRIHRSSAPATLSSGSPQITSPSSVVAPASIKPEPLEQESSDVVMSTSMDSEPCVSQELDLEIEGGGVDTENIDPGTMECMDVEEEEDINGDVIRCSCNESEEGGFMIQCEQCLTWQHSECVGLSEQTVPPNYVCYVCAKPRGLRKSAKYKNDYDWFRRGTLACMPFSLNPEPEYSAELNLATHGLMSDMHDVNRSLRSLKLKFELLRKPSHPDLKCWKKPQRGSTTNVDQTESTEKTVKDSCLKNLSEQGPKTAYTESKSSPVVNGHTEPGALSENGLPKVKEECPSTPPLPEEGPGDTNNNIQDKSAPVLSAGSVLMSTVSSSSGTGEGSVSASIESRPDKSEGQSDVMKKEEDPQSPIPALVPAGGQTVFMKSASSELGKPEEKSASKSEIVQSAVKPGNGTEGTEKSVELKPSGGSSRGDHSEVKTPPGETNPQMGSEAQVKQENESRNPASGGGTRASEIKTENQESGQSLSDDESVGAMNNLLDDITQIQDGLEGRMDQIEQQLAVLEEAYGTPSQPVRKTEFRKLVRDLNRVRRLLQQVS